MTTFPDRQPADFAKLREWIEKCDPNQALPAGDPRYFDFAAQEDKSLRGLDHLGLLKDPILLGLPSSCQLFSGFRGTGKSTELQRLKSDLEQEGFAVLLVDAGEYHDLAHPLVFEDLLVILGAALGEAIDARLQDRAPKRSFWRKVADLAQKIRIDEKTVSTPGDILGVPLPQLDLKYGVKSDLDFWHKVRAFLKTKPAALRDELHQHVRFYIEALRREEPRRRGVVFIVDGLERLSGPLTELDDFIDHTLAVFSADPSALRLPGCHVIYTIPPYVQLLNPGLRHSYRVGVALPTIKIRERYTGDSFEPGIQALIGLLRKRIPQIEQLFASPQVLEKLVISSGGHVRNLLGLMVDLLFQARRLGLPIHEADVDTVAQLWREPMRLAITSEAATMLERVRQTESFYLRQGRDVANAVGSLTTNLLILHDGEKWLTTVKERHI